MLLVAVILFGLSVVVALAEVCSEFSARRSLGDSIQESLVFPRTFRFVLMFGLVLLAWGAFR